MKNHFLQTCLIVLSIGFLSSSNHSVNAQVPVFNLKDYKNPTYRYQMLETGFNLNSAYSSNNSKLFDTTQWNRAQSSRFGSDFNADYTCNSNSPTYQGYQALSIGLATDFSFQTFNPTYDYRNQHTTNNLSLQGRSNNRFYFRSPYYFEISPSAALSLQTDFNKMRFPEDLNETTVETKVGNRLASAEAGLGLSVGKGRIEQVQDAQLAFYILDDLVKHNRMKATLSNDDVFELARLITELKTTRFFDSRIRKIREITAIDSLLEKRGLKGTADAAYYTTINDNWLYSNNPARLSGYSVYAMVRPSVYYSSSLHKADTLKPSDIKTRSRTIKSAYGAQGTIGITYEKPVCMQWQHSAWANIAYLYDISENISQVLLPDELDKVLNYKDTEPFFFSRIGCSAGYYPTTRTWMVASINSIVQYSDRDRESDVISPYTGKTNFNFLVSASFSSYHYLSERLRLELHLGTNFQYMKDESGTSPDPLADNTESWTRYWSGSLNAKLTYSLF